MATMSDVDSEREEYSTSQIRQYLVDSLKKKHQENYQWVIDSLKHKEMTDSVMEKWLTVLRNCITILNDDFIVSATLSFPWAQFNGPVIDMYIGYLSDLISVYPYYLPSVLHSLVTLAINPEHDLICVYDNVHKALKTLLYLIPKAAMCLFKTLEGLAPYKGRTSNYQEVFLKCCLQIVKYYPNLTTEILQLVILKMLQIDAEVSPILIEEDSDELSEQFSIEMDVDISSSERSCLDSTQNQSAFHYSLKPCHSLYGNMDDKMADSIDVMMTVMFEFMEEICFENEKIASDAAVNFFKTLLKIFEDQIYVTHGSSHVQFLLFKLTSYSPEFPAYFLDILWQKFQDTNTPNVLRQSCAAYMSSYLARANFVSLNTIKVCLHLMTKWIHQYLDKVYGSGNTLRPDLSRHCAFYSLCQAVFYIFVFHHKSLIEMEGGRAYIRQLNFEWIISSKLNPLKMCLTSIVEIFASVTNKYEIVFCYSILEANKRLILPSSATPNANSKPSVLETVFPFDPYHLKRSSCYINEIYRSWTFDDDDESKEVETSVYDHDFSLFVPSSVESLQHSLTPS